MFKFGTIKAYDLARTNPRCKATAALKLGMVVIPNDATKTAPVPATLAEGQGKDLWVVNNRIDQPEILNKQDFVVASGEYVRAFRLADLVGLPVELDTSVVSTAYADLAVGDKLIPCDAVTHTTNAGKWVEGATTSYSIYLEVLEKTSFGNGEGLYCKVVVA
jgi:hypothetical protein